MPNTRWHVAVSDDYCRDLNGYNIDQAIEEAQRIAITHGGSGVMLFSGSCFISGSRAVAHIGPDSHTELFVAYKDLRDNVPCARCGKWWDTISPCALCNASRTAYQHNY